MAKMPLPSPEVLRQLIRYEPKTGRLLWKERGLEWFKVDENQSRYCQRWNTIYSGKEAMTTLERKGYLVGRVLYKTLKAHRVAWAIHHGEWPSDQIDHINGDKADNRLSNLRETSPAGNAQNRPRRSDNKSGATGVFKKDGRWAALITFEQKRHWLGMHETKSEAIAARQAAETELGFHPNHGRE